MSDRRCAWIALFATVLIATGCAAETDPSRPAPSASAPATTRGTAAAPTPMPPTPPPTARPTVVPTLTPLSLAEKGRGTWFKVKGAALVGARAAAVRAGDRGVLLVDGAAQGAAEACQPPERNAGGTLVAFYDAQTHRITRVSGDVRLYAFSMASMPDGRVMIAGGFKSLEVQEPTRRTRIWSPRTRAWTEGPRMRRARVDHDLLTLADGRLMAIGGWVAVDDGMADTLDAELYDPATNRWTSTGPVPLVVEDAGPDQFERAIALTGGQVLAMGGNFTGALYDPGTGTWTPVEPPGWRFAVPLLDGTALDFSVGYADDLFNVELPLAVRFDPHTLTSTVIGHWAPPDQASIVVLPDGRLLVAGGVVEDEGGYLGDFQARVEVFDPVADKRLEIASMPAARGEATAVALNDGSVLVVGGIDRWELEGDTAGCVPVAYRVVRWVP